LHSLEHNELVSGFSEVIKYGAIRDPELFNYLERNYKLILELDPETLQKIVADSASIKVQIVESDVFEQDKRKHLNFGHTLGHAIEKISGMLHGEAVAIGMVLASRLSVKLGFLQADEAKRLEMLISASGLPIITGIPASDIFTALLKDKKRAGGIIHFILLKKIGEAFVHKLELDTLKKVIYDLY
jgi:3-dehydroquinate synthase